MKERVQKVLAAAGLGSRRACEELVAEGRVSIDGRTATLGDKADPLTQVVAVDGERIHTNPDLVYLLLNKPVGVVTTASDPEGRPTVLDLVPANPRVYPVGRLDADTQGLLLLTNDGELANRVAHPRWQVEKTYLAQVMGPVRKRALRQLTDGVELDDGLARAADARVLGSDRTRSLIEITLTEGRKREVRRMVAAVNLQLTDLARVRVGQREVRRMVAAVNLQLTDLARVRVGPIELGDIRPGKVRPLRGDEVRALYAAVGMGAEGDR